MFELFGVAVFRRVPDPGEDRAGEPRLELEEVPVQAVVDGRAGPRRQTAPVIGIAPADSRIDGEPLPSGEGVADLRHQFESGVREVRRDAAVRVLAHQVRIVADQRVVGARSEERPLVARDGHPRPRAVERRTVHAGEVLVAVHRAVQRKAADQADDVPAVVPRIARRVVDVGVRRLHRLEAGEVADVRPGAKPARQTLVGRAAQLVAALCRQPRPRFVRRLFLVEPVRLEVSVRAGAEVVAVFTAVPLRRVRKPVVQRRGVLAAVDGPEEGVVKRLAAERGRPVGRQQEPGRAVLTFGRVIQERRVQQRHALHPEHRVAQQGVLVEIQHHRRRMELPARRRLHAGREAAIRDPVLLRAGLLDGFAEKVHVRVRGERLAGDGGGGRPSRRARRPAPPRVLASAVSSVDRSAPCPRRCRTCRASSCDRTRRGRRRCGCWPVRRRRCQSRSSGSDR